MSSIATLAAIAVLASVLAYWTWAWLGPHAEPRVAPATSVTTGAAAKTLFGTVPTERIMASPGGTSVTLIGVAAGSRQAGGYAVVQIGGRDIVAAREGADIAAGIRLAEVHADRIVLDRSGSRETIAWPQSVTMTLPSAPVQSTGVSNAAVTPGAAAGSPRSPGNALTGPAPTKAERDRLSD